LGCTATPFLECGYLINARLPPSLAFCILYYNYTIRRARGGGNVGARVEGRDRDTIGKEETCWGCRVRLTTRTRSSPSLSRSAHSRSLDGERGQGLCNASTFHTTLVKKSQEGNGAFELLRTLRPRIRVNKGVAVLNPRPQLSVFPLARSGLRSRRLPCGSRILWQLPFGDLCQRALSCLGTLRSPARTV